MSTGYNTGIPAQLDTDTILGETLEADAGHLYFTSGKMRHPVRVMATSRDVRVGCVRLTREAWETLKKRVDGEPQ